MSMRPPVDRQRIISFLQQLGQRFRRLGRVYLVGGTTLVFEALRTQTKISTLRWRWKRHQLVAALLQPLKLSLKQRSLLGQQRTLFHERPNTHRRIKAVYEPVHEYHRLWSCWLKRAALGQLLAERHICRFEFSTTQVANKTTWSR